MVVSRSLYDSTAATVLSMMVSGGCAGGFLLKSTNISTVLSFTFFNFKCGQYQISSVNRSRF